ncbi:hypothetical protein PLICRDRAFT_33505 [Plicaturopsis crispa FD-325 SS-3]|nr:hypothetical protein PLICRDRAFT_33505 [Plicaturopsis crispa FD-325 SS-3]
MATALLLSQHSSNPLEVSPSNACNRKYHRQYKEAKLNRGSDYEDDSSDPIHGYQRPEMEQYRDHLQQLFPGLHQPGPSRSAVEPGMVDLDEDMDSEDELNGVLPDGAEEEAVAEEDQEMDAEVEDSEEMSILLKPQEERDEIEEEIAELEDAVPQLDSDYKIIDRLGTGTFSSVYKAIDIGYHDKWDNTPWHGFHPPSSSAHYQSVSRPPGSKVFVAIKRIYVTSNPERIRNEVAIMEDCRGCRHVAQLITAFRHEDQVVAIMPYNKNEDFRDFYRGLSMGGIKAYFRCMFRALRDVHSRGIIHRDVKPANFLFDPRTGVGTLCDFGLASRMEPGPIHGACLHSSPTREYPHGRHLQRGEFDVEHLKKMQREARQKSSWPSEKVGYPDKDTRPHSKANRAGTRGFRAPEVLLKCGEQSGAIDVWAAGMILLFFLTGKFPLFQSNDDVEALMEIAAIIGRRRMEKAATLHSRTFATNVPSITPEGTSWRAFVERQNPNLKTPVKPDPRYYPHTNSRNNTQSHINSHLPPSSSSTSSTPMPSSRSPSPAPSSPAQVAPDEAHAAELDAAFDLLDQLMHPESTRRITPRGALYHPFLADPDAPEDDEFFPHPFGEGVCGEAHFIDPDTDEPRVRIGLGDGRYVVKSLLAGEGVAIGRHPCEYHEAEFGYEG